MDTLKIIAIVVGVAILLSQFIDLTKVKNYLVGKVVEPTPSNLVDIVTQWREFRKICVANDLKDAVAKLDEIFPTLVQAEK